MIDVVHYFLWLYSNFKMITLYLRNNVIVKTLITLWFFRSASSEIPERHLILSSISQPLVNNSELSTMSVGIVEYMILETLSKNLNFTYEIRPPTDMFASGFVLQNGSWTGTTGQLQRKEVDLCLTTTVPTIARHSVMSFSQPVIFVDDAIIIPIPSEKSKIWIDAMFLPSVYIFATICFVIWVFASYLIYRITTRESNVLNREGFDYWILFFMSICSSQGFTMRITSVHLRITCATAYLGIFIWLNYVIANYTSLLSTKIFKTSINSIEELVHSETIKTLIFKGSATEDYIMNSSKNNSISAKIVKEMLHHPERRISNTFTFDDISTIVKDDYALITSKSNGKSLVQKSYNLNGKKCRVVLADKYFFNRLQSFGYQKMSPIARILDIHILRIQQSGIIQYAERRAAISINQCSVSEITKTSSTETVPLQIKDVIGAFFAVSLGSGLGILMIILELITALLKKR